MTALEELIHAAVAAPLERQVEALRVLRGEPHSPEPAPVPAASEPEPYLTLKEVAKRLGLNPCSLWRWRVPSHNLGGRPKYRLSEIVAYLDSDSMKRRLAALRAERRDERASAFPLNLATAATGQADASGDLDRITPMRTQRPKNPLS